MSDDPKLTVVTASLNQAEYLEPAIRSVLDQNYSNLEYMVIDGGSTDGSVDIIKKYQDHLTYWVSSPDAGQADALNQGFARATGEWLAWLNSDDYYLEGAFDAFAGVARQDSENTALLFGTGEVLDQASGDVRPFWPHPPAFDRDALLYGIDYIMQPTAFFRRDAFEACGGLNSALQYCMDYDLWIRLARDHTARPLTHAIACEREHDRRKTARGGFERWIEIRNMIAGHTGLELTPGLVDYLGQTLLEMIEIDGAKLFPAGARRAVEILLYENQALQRAFCKSGDWFPSPESVAAASLFDRLAAAPAEPGFFDRVETQGQDLQAAKKLLAEVSEDSDRRLESMSRLEQLLEESEADGDRRLENISRLEQLLEESELDRDRRLESIAKLEQLLEESEADRVTRLDNITNLEQQLKESEVDGAARLDNVTKLEFLLKESEADRAARLENIIKLGQLLEESEADRAARLERIREFEALRQDLEQHDYRKWPIVRLFAGKRTD